MEVAGCVEIQARKIQAREIQARRAGQRPTPGKAPSGAPFIGDVYLAYPESYDDQSYDDCGMSFHEQLVSELRRRRSRDFTFPEISKWALLGDW